MNDDARLILFIVTLITVLVVLRVTPPGVCL